MPAKDPQLSCSCKLRTESKVTELLQIRNCEIRILLDRFRIRTLWWWQALPDTANTLGMLLMESVRR